MRLLAHNLIAHPIAGILWALGLDALGDSVHGWWTPKPIQITKIHVRAEYSGDPDRIFAAFLPKLTELSDRRTAPYEPIEP